MTAVSKYFLIKCQMDEKHEFLQVSSPLNNLVEHRFMYISLFALSTVKSTIERSTVDKMIINLTARSLFKAHIV